MPSRKCWRSHHSAVNSVRDRKDTTRLPIEVSAELCHQFENLAGAGLTDVIAWAAVCLRRLWEEGKLAREELVKRGVAEFSPFDANSWRSRFEQLGETLPQDTKHWFKVGASCSATAAGW